MISRVRNLTVDNEVLELGLFNEKIQSWMNKMWKTSWVYTCTLTQVGEADPVASVLEDTIGSPVWARTDVGTYTLTKTGAFIVGKSVPKKEEQYYDKDLNRFTLTPTSIDAYTLKTYAAVDDQTLADGVLVDQYINIEVYP